MTERTSRWIDLFGGDDVSRKKAQLDAACMPGFKFDRDTFQPTDLNLHLLGKPDMNTSIAVAALFYRPTSLIIFLRLAFDARTVVIANAVHQGARLPSPAAFFEQVKTYLISRNVMDLNGRITRRDISINLLQGGLLVDVENLRALMVVYAQARDDFRQSADDVRFPDVHQATLFQAVDDCLDQYPAAFLACAAADAEDSAAAAADATDSVSEFTDSGGTADLCDDRVKSDKDHDSVHDQAESNNPRAAQDKSASRRKATRASAQEEQVTSNGDSAHPTKSNADILRGILSEVPPVTDEAIQEVRDLSASMVENSGTIARCMDELADSMKRWQVLEKMYRPSS